MNRKQAASYGIQGTGRGLGNEKKKGENKTHGHNSAGLPGDREQVEKWKNNGKRMPITRDLPHRIVLQPAALYILAFSSVSLTAQLLEHLPCHLTKLTS